MKIIAPSFYTKFQCIADKCGHSCCRGWEIDIDEYTLDLYCSVQGDFGERLRENIVLKDDTPMFLLREDESCPFLNEKGLCDIIINLGEDALCDICAMHPRYSVDFDTFVSEGQGLCCEEAVRLACQEEDLHMETIWDENGLPFTEWEQKYLSEQKEVTDILEDKGKSYDEKRAVLGEMNGFDPGMLTENRMKEVLGYMEVLDPKWNGLLGKADLSQKTDSLSKDEDRAFSNILFCLAVRHIPDNCPSYDLMSGLRIALFIAEVMLRMYLFRSETEGRTMDILTDTVRMVSSELEYSEDNMLQLRDIFEAPELIFKISDRRKADISCIK